jgi:hypothetical protein
MPSYVTRTDRFLVGDYPMICVQTGRPATHKLEVEAKRTSSWPWFLMPVSILWFFVSGWLSDGYRPTGKLPFAAGETPRVKLTYDRLIGVVIRGAHPDFIEACRQVQGR